MKVKDIEKMLDLLGGITEYTNKLDYNTSSFINQKVVQVKPILEEELKRLEATDVDINCPKIMIFTNMEALQQDMKVQDLFNLKLKELVINGYKIIDYGKMDEQWLDDNTREILFFIKYTD